MSASALLFCELNVIFNCLATLLPISLVWFAYFRTTRFISRSNVATYRNLINHCGTRRSVYKKNTQIPVICDRISILHYNDFVAHSGNINHLVDLSS